MGVGAAAGPEQVGDGPAPALAEAQDGHGQGDEEEQGPEEEARPIRLCDGGDRARIEAGVGGRPQQGDEGAVQGGGAAERRRAGPV